MANKKKIAKEVLRILVERGLASEALLQSKTPEEINLFTGLELGPVMRHELNQALRENYGATVDLDFCETIGDIVDQL